MNTSNDWLTKVRTLIKRAETEEAKDHAPKAIAYYKKALDLIPEPFEESPYATRLCIAIGELYFLNRDYEQAFKYFTEAVRSKGGLGLAHIHLRLGQLYYERGQIERARDELLRAYMGSGKLIFELENPKYYNLIKETVEK